MRRRIIAAVWIAGATVPLLMATVFFVGCCVLPFHGVMHKLMPLCEMAANAFRGDRPADANDATPARETQQPAKRMASITPMVYRLFAETRTVQTMTPIAATAYRSFISQGAIRCDRDVGLHVLVATFLI
ncbi:MAG TPA: hypothetical protein VGQ76_22020 [Thermoanaerobaculia bacterium]|jgi:hypothetical protein|nr:hypothetical protein [Thermoanaerobaculia bacterium]